MKPFVNKPYVNIRNKPGLDGLDDDLFGDPRSCSLPFFFILTFRTAADSMFKNILIFICVKFSGRVKIKVSTLKTT